MIPMSRLASRNLQLRTEIKKAYRQLVKVSHPHLNPDDPGAEAQFKSISAAYDLLKDPATRARFDAR